MRVDIQESFDPKILLGRPGSLGVFKKFVQKHFVFIFRSLQTRAEADLVSLTEDHG